MKSHLVFYLLIVCLYSSCIDPFEAAVGGAEKLLVVDGRITNGEGPYYINIKYSGDNISTVNDNVGGAMVKVQDNTGVEYPFTYIEDGMYESPASMRGLIGNSYKLTIKHNSKQYESGWCLLQEPSCIDNANFGVATGFIGNKEVNVLGINVDASVCEDEETYLRWEVEEDWKVSLPKPESMLMTNDTTFEPIDNWVRYCYRNNINRTIIVHSFQNQASNQVADKEIYRSSTYSTDRFTNRFRATINQYSISKEEYTFWSRLKETSEEMGDFFGKQPFGVVGNIHCTTKPNEKVLGFFQVAGVSSKELYVTISDVLSLKLPLFRPKTCSVDTIKTEDVTSLYDSYERVKKVGSKTFYTPYYTEDEESLLLGIIFTEASCGKCSASGASSIPPIGWRED